ncbi:type I methionyl aminopeptidase [Pedobacter cryoconitis]|uniref:type I methionyl aminopeptidase n=1 Tax=Pedobacter cryoconitis TaxID=188932 RepID=UPI00161FC45C|nr:type I methionyl aminopeptidase [Pedobacter cryoconitis]MBB5645617.1 methionyl aminopeptidase [Pedobacter cryoconitis]
MIILKTEEEVELIRISATLISSTLTEVAKVLKPGITTMALDKLAAEYIADHGAIPSFLNYEGYPHHICTSVNDVVVHGMPNDKPLSDGDIVSVDIGVIKNEFHGDHAYTFIIGEADQEVIDLVRVTKECLYEGINNAVAGSYLTNISSAIQRHAEGNGYGVVREFVGHGLGRSMHEHPQVPNYGRRNEGILMKENLVLAIEPMVNLGTKDIHMSKDGWTVRTADGKPSVHFEHDVCVKPGHAMILSNYTLIEIAEKANRNLNSSYY